MNEIIKIYAIIVAGNENNEDILPGESPTAVQDEDVNRGAMSGTVPTTTTIKLFFVVMSFGLNAIFRLMIGFSVLIGGIRFYKADQAFVSFVIFVSRAFANKPTGILFALTSYHNVISQTIIQLPEVVLLTWQLRECGRFKITQATTHKTVKHAKAEQLRLHFKEKNQEPYLVCGDEGNGFESEMLRRGRTGMGPGSLKSRTEFLAGKLSCTSKLRYGTEYFFVFPCERNGQDN